MEEAGQTAAYRRNGAAGAHPDPPVPLQGWAPVAAHVLFIRDRQSPLKKGRNVNFFFKGI